MDKKLQQVADDVLSKLTNDIYKLINDNMLFGYNDKDDVFYTLSNKEIIDTIYPIYVTKLTIGTNIDLIFINEYPTLS